MVSYLSKFVFLSGILFGCAKDHSTSVLDDKASPSTKEISSQSESSLTLSSKPKFDAPVDVSAVKKEAPTKANQARLKLVWMSLDGFQANALRSWVDKIKKPHPKGLHWLLTKARGKSDLRVVNPTITAPSHISTITCTPAGVHGILDNSPWTGAGTVSGFGKLYEPENWVARLRRHGLRVGVAFYPSIDGNGEGRSGDIGIAYDTAGSSTQMISISKNASVDVIVPARSTDSKSFTLRLTSDANGNVTGTSPWGSIPELKVATPQDFIFKSPIKGVERTVGVSLMLVSVKEKSLVGVSPVQVMPVFGSDFAQWIDKEQIFFSSLKDYKMQTYVPSYLAAMKHRQDDIFKVNRTLLSRDDLDAMFIYFPDLDSLLHGFYKDAANEKIVVDYLAGFDKELGRLIESIPSSADFLVVGDHGMSAIAYSLNARKILGEDVASKGYVTTSGGSMYFYPPPGSLDAPPPADVNLEQIAERLQKMEFEVTKGKIFAKVLVRGSKEAIKEGLGGQQMPWIMAFANDGIGFKNSVEDRLLLAKASWATIPDRLQSKYPEAVNNGIADRPVPAGQHGHYNGLAQMRTRLVMEGPRFSKIPLTKLERTLQLVPAVADAEGWPRPKGCLKIGPK